MKLSRLIAGLVISAVFAAGSVASAADTTTGGAKTRHHARTHAKAGHKAVAKKAGHKNLGAKSHHRIAKGQHHRANKGVVKKASNRQVKVRHPKAPQP
jgi:hypothetical protein